MNARRTAVGFCAAAAIAWAAKRAHSLDASGALAATAVGTCVYSGLGVPGTIVMLGFFVPATLLSKYAKRRNGSNPLTDKDGPRDAAQVLANGGFAAMAAFFGSRPWGKRAFAAALAAASSDTWSTEIGTTFGGAPRNVLTGEPGERGLSGNVSDAGVIGAIAGAGLIAGLAALCGLGRADTTAAAGIGGGLVDSLLGATLQSLSRCTVCRKYCEIQVHCNQPTEHFRGRPYINNDAVNAIAVLAAIGFSELATIR